MSLTEGNGGNEMVMPVAPMYGGGGSGFGGWGGDNGWWIILLFLFALGGWGSLVSVVAMVRAQCLTL